MKEKPLNEYKYSEEDSSEYTKEEMKFLWDESEKSSKIFFKEMKELTKTEFNTNLW